MTNLCGILAPIGRGPDADDSGPSGSCVPRSIPGSRPRLPNSARRRRGGSRAGAQAHSTTLPRPSPDWTDFARRHDPFGRSLSRMIPRARGSDGWGRGTRGGQPEAGPTTRITATSAMLVAISTAWARPSPPQRGGANRPAPPQNTDWTPSPDHLQARSLAAAPRRPRRGPSAP